ncbi:hypothetical protein DVK05_00010 [Halorubrum sp. Atlit-8R]|nr:hypothetical protein DVK05_00010 [Halorubrum sp. Atlit-8R]
MRAMPKEPNTIAYITDESVCKIAIDGDGIKQLNELLADPTVWRVEPCCGDISTAIDIAAVVGSHPDTLTTAVRVSYMEAGGIQHLPVINETNAHRDAREAAVELFFSAFTENKIDASLPKSELFDGFCDWHLNLTGQSISRSWFGRALAEVDVELQGGHVPNRTWTAEALEALQN